MNLFSLFKSKPKEEIKPEVKIVEKIIYQKSFNSAKIDRLNEDFLVAIARINEDIRNSLSNLRGRSRTSAQNNDYYIRYLDLYTSYLIGAQGFTLVCKGKDNNGEIDRSGNKAVEKGWKDFGKKTSFSRNKRETFFSFQYRAAYTFARDGEVFVRIHKGKSAKNKYGISYSFIDADYLDESYNVESSSMRNGNRICQGIELDMFDTVVGYWFTEVPETINNYGTVPKGGIKSFVPADEIIHWYNKVQMNQYRGFPPGQNLLISLHGLSELNESEMVSFRAASCKMGFKQQKFPSEEAIDFVGGADNRDYDELQPGVIEKLGYNEEFIGFNPDHKSGNWETFSKGILRSASSGCGFPYALISNDYEGLSGDAVRVMILDAREYAIGKQNLMKDELIDPIYESAYPYFFFSVSLPYNKIDKFSDHDFRGRAFQALRPLEEANAMKILWDCGGDSRTDYMRTLNKDIDDIFSELGYEEELSVFYGIPLRNQGGYSELNMPSKGEPKK